MVGQVSMIQEACNWIQFLIYSYSFDLVLILRSSFLFPNISITIMLSLQCFSYAIWKRKLFQVEALLFFYMKDAEMNSKFFSIFY